MKNNWQSIGGKISMGHNWENPEFRKRQSNRMKLHNPMFIDSVKKKHSLVHSKWAIKNKLFVGDSNPMRNPIIKAKIIRALKTKSVIKKLSDCKKGDKNPMKRPEVAKKMSDTMKRKIKSGEIVTYLQKKKLEKDDKFWASFIKASAIARTVKPSNIEKILGQLLKKVSCGFLYNGDFNKMIGKKNPDWINEKSHKIIEIFGCYTHGCEYHFPKSRHRKFSTNSEAEIDKSNYFKIYGYKTLIIWEHELVDIEILKNKIREFINEMD